MCPFPTPSLVVALLSAPTTAAFQTVADDPPPLLLDDRTFERWRDFIHPSAAELAAEGIDWNVTLWSGRIRAQEEKKPLLIWIMNGHPCGLT
jgi:hypothetical protein